MISMLFIFSTWRLIHKHEDKYRMDLRVMQLYRSAPEWHEEVAKGLA
jgi:hypothetical protein